MQTTIPIPDGKSLLPYQIEGICYALERKGTLIADEMGLGKTVQAIGVINAIPDAYHVVIVCPASLILNWRRELERWCVAFWKRHIDVVSYDSLPKIQYSQIGILVADEAHYVKNPKAKRTIEFQRLAKLSDRVVLLTGTPIENKPIELWPLLQAVNPEYWDPAGTLYKKNKETRRTDRSKVGPGEGAGFFKFALRYCDGKQEWRGRKKVWVFDGHSNLPELGQKLRETCMIRRMKADVLTQLPEKRRQIIVLPGEEQESAFLSDLTEENYDETVRRLHADKAAFAEFSRVRHMQGVSKVDAVGEHLEMVLEGGSEKVIVFAYHHDVVLALRDRLADYQPVCITGNESVPERQAAADRFQHHPKCRVIIGTIGAMGVGWTLTASSHVVFAEIDPVPGRMNQAEDRAHRLTQRNNVLVQHLVRDRSLDARLIQILVKKQEVVRAALNEVRACAS